MTAAHTPHPERDRMYAFIVTGSYVAERRITSPELSAAVAKSLALAFAEPAALNSYVLPRMSTPLAYDLMTVWTSLSAFERAHIKEISPELFNAITLLLKAVPDNATDDSSASTGERDTSTATQAVSG